MGSVMGSTGGEYVTVNPGKVLVEGQSLMLNDGAEATVAYYYYFDDGKRFRKCVEKYEGPNTYVIDDSCKKAAYLSSGSTAKTIGVVVGRLDRVQMARDQCVHADIRPDQTGVDVNGLRRNHPGSLALPHHTRENLAEDVFTPTLPDARQ